MRIIRNSLKENYRGRYPNHCSNKVSNIRESYRQINKRNHMNELFGFGEKQPKFDDKSYNDLDRCLYNVVINEVDYAQTGETNYAQRGKWGVMIEDDYWSVSYNNDIMFSCFKNKVTLENTCGFSEYDLDAIKELVKQDLKADNWYDIKTY